MGEARNEPSHKTAPTNPKHCFGHTTKILHAQKAREDPPPQGGTAARLSCPPSPTLTHPPARAPRFTRYGLRTPCSRRASRRHSRPSGRPRSSTQRRSRSTTASAGDQSEGRMEDAKRTREGHRATNLAIVCAHDGRIVCSGAESLSEILGRE